MPDPKLYVEVSKIDPIDIYDDKVKNELASYATGLVEAAVKKSGSFTDAKPKDKGVKGWLLLGNLNVGPDKAGTKFVGKVALTISVWPARSIKSSASGIGQFGIEKGEKISLSDAKQAVKKAAEEAAKTAISFMESKTPE